MMKNQEKGKEGVRKYKERVGTEGNM